MSSKAKKFTKNTAFLTSSKLINMIIALVSLYFYTRVLTTLELALIPVLEIVASLVSIVSSVGLDLFVQRRMPKILSDDANEARVLSRTYVLSVLSGVSLCCVILFAISEPVSVLLLKSPDFAWQIRLLIPAVMVACWWNVISQLFLGSSMFMQLGCFSMFSQVMHPVAVLSLYTVMGTSGLIVGLALGKGIVCLVFSYRLRDYMFGQVPWRKAFGYIRSAWPCYAESYINYPMGYADRWLVGIFLTPVDLAIYYIPRALFEKMKNLIKALSDVMLANMSIHKGVAIENLQQLFRQMYRLSVFLFVPICVSLASLSYYLIDVLAGAKYQAGAVPFGFLVFALLVVGLFAPYYLGLLAWLEPQIRLFVVLVQSLAVFILTPTLGWLWGLNGFAASKGLVILISSFMSIYYMRKHFDVKADIKALQQVILPSAGLLITIIAGQLFFYDKLMVPIYAILGFAVYLLLFLKRLGSHDIDVLAEVMPAKLSAAVSYARRYRKTSSEASKVSPL